MSTLIGKDLEVGVAFEGTRATAESAADKWQRKVSATVVERAVHAIDESSRGVLETGEGRRVVQKYIEGEVSGPVHADAIGYYLANLYGVCVSSNVTGSIYSHVFTLGQNIQHPSLTMFAHDGSVQSNTYSGCMVSSLEINVALDDYVRYTAGILGNTAATSTDTPSYDTEYDFIAHDVTVKMADTSGGLAAATAIKCKDLTLTWNPEVDRDHVIGGYVPDDIYNKGMMIEGSFTLNFGSETYKDLFLGDDSKYMSVTITGETDLGSGNYPSITLLLYKVQIMDWNRSGDGSELVTEPISFRAFYNPTDSKQSQVTLVNLTSAYDEVPSS